MRCVAPALTLVVLLGGCAVPRPSATASDPALAPCEATAPNQIAPPTGETESVHLGNGSLGTDLWPDGAVVAQPEWISPDGAVEVKWPWWRADGVVGVVEITGKRLDAAGPPLTGVQNPSSGHTGFTPSAITFPSAGCWEVTGRVGDARLTFVTRVIVP